ncbi:DsrE family protein [Halomicroarcula sp. GCM10025709]|uniref:DsrE family protein n=1 Tax=Haloarcula TaxID=2237 RepID=UPI0024C39BC1|nr:DsrE family protein [Halomicroarcula sp. YJ-61-S]
MDAVIHLTSDAEADRRHALRCATVLRDNDALDLADVALLLHRDGVRLATPASPEYDWLVELLGSGVTVTLGTTCLDAREIPHDAVPAGVELVPSGVSELVSRQAAGAHYVKIP